MKSLLVVIVLAGALFAQSAKAPSLVADDAIRVAEFYGLAPSIEDKV
jgi:hypothetical protein